MGDKVRRPWRQKLTAGALLIAGTMPDAAVGEMFGVSFSAVAAFRREHSIPSHRSTRYQWKQIDAALGLDQDGAVAHRFQISRTTVHRRRVALGVPGPGGRRYQCSLSPEEIALLGTQSDARIGATIKCSAVAVASWRRKRGIAPFRTVHREWLEMWWWLGAMPDAELAGLSGMSTGAISSLRFRRRIPCFVFDKECLVCGVEYQTIAERGLFCSRKCAKDYHQSVRPGSSCLAICRSDPNMAALIGCLIQCQRTINQQQRGTGNVSKVYVYKKRAHEG